MKELLCCFITRDFIDPTDNLKINENLVFCKDCIWLKEHKEFNGYVLRDCKYFDNEEAILDYYTYSKKYKEHPKVINKNNDCKWFEKKESLWKMFWDGFRVPGGGPGNP